MHKHCCCCDEPPLIDLTDAQKATIRAVVSFAVGAALDAFTLWLAQSGGPQLPTEGPTYPPGPPPPQPPPQP